MPFNSSKVVPTVFFCRGIALISTLITIGIASFLLTKIVIDQSKSIQRLSSSINYQQMLMYHFSIENLASKLLSEDGNFNVDSCEDDWATKMPPYPIENGVIDANLLDLNSRLNINILQNLKDLQNAKHSTTAQPNSPERLVFNVLNEKLLKQGFNNATNASLAIADWVDEDTKALNLDGSTGAESGYYLSLPLPYRSTDQAMLDLRELNQVKNIHSTSFSADKPTTIYKFLTSKTPYSCQQEASIDVFPSYKPTTNTITPININTANCEIITDIIHSYDTNQSRASIKDIVEAQLCPSINKNKNSNPQELKSTTNFSNVEGFFAALDSSSLADENAIKWSKKIPKELFSVKSQYFLLEVKIKLANCTMQASSTLYRSNKIITRISRQINFFQCIE